MKKFHLLTILLFSTLRTFACSCEPIPFNQAVEWADEIFVGRLIEVKELFNESYPEAPNQKHTTHWSATFEIEKKWKGSRKKYITIYQDGNSCGFNFTNINQNYLVYAENKSILGVYTTPTTWLCSRTINEYNSSEKSNYKPDQEKLDAKFPETINLYNFNLFSWSYFYPLSIFLIGLFIGRKTKKATH
ncbi:hypothetical protein BTO06_15345 [Tenacibaculum sp. SZ-18]|uniref:hypothetical protein n=1 Tax=Tenacibaculum sp. SZ-18 TaxID=754423 RepID=UPI000C2D37AF|nr:hypothetical protein [Tenacibaculum sp. SZ-18]AUC16440.1 hypothetical protein BTO06_15345 [Tenacibaculum sp. SZ-18]